MSDPLSADVAVVGGGGAGLALVHALARRDPELSVVVVDPVTRTGNDRTWCFWAPTPTLVDDAVEESWRYLTVAGAGSEHRLDIHPLRYHLVRSADFFALVDATLAQCRRLQVTRLAVHAEEVSSAQGAGGPAVDGSATPGHETEGRAGPWRRAVDRVGRARVLTSGPEITADWVFDSRPVSPLRPGQVWWWQHFRGWVLPAGSLPAAAVPRDPVLMDFDVTQPAHGLAFGYCLPLAGDRLLVEYTEFSRERLTDSGYDVALRAYLDRLGVPRSVVPEHVETGAIPMTDGRFARTAGPGVVRLGTAGGATRGSTGYTFAAMLRQAEAAADALVAGRPAVPPPAYPPRHRWLDAVLLRALDRGYLDGPEFFLRLFDRQPATRVLRFLDGLTTPFGELSVMASSPFWPMMRAIVTPGRLAAPGRGPSPGRLMTPGPAPSPTRRQQRGQHGGG